jgi:hypothetical protein
MLDELVFPASASRHSPFGSVFAACAFAARRGSAPSARAPRPFTGFAASAVRTARLPTRVPVYHFFLFGESLWIQHQLMMMRPTVASIAVGAVLPHPSRNDGRRGPQLGLTMYIIGLHLL